MTTKPSEACGHEDIECPHDTCRIASLPDRLQSLAIEVARQAHPENVPPISARVSAVPDTDVPREFIALITRKYWGTKGRKFTVSFQERTSTALRKRIVSELNAWSYGTSIEFVETQSHGVVRITLVGDGYWSYLGTDILLIPKNKPTMCLSGFSLNTPDSEYRRVVRHEAGHTLGFPHEHMRQSLVDRIDKRKAYAFFAKWQGWSRSEVDQQVLTPLDSATLMGTPPDQTSIMCYHLPGDITKDGKPIVGGSDINKTDLAFAQRHYPATLNGGQAAPRETVHPELTPTWSVAEDIPFDSAMEVLRGTEM